MTTTPIAPTEANIRETPGGWFATPADEDFPQVGVMGTDRDDALTQLAEARAQWRALLAESQQ